MAVRIDKWLWSARFFKTRGLATQKVNGGHVRLNGERVKAAKLVQSGDVLHIVREQEKFLVTVIGLAEKRVSANMAEKLYVEDAQSIKQRQEQQLLRQQQAPSAPQKRPDKKARRQIIRFRRRED